MRRDYYAPGRLRARGENFFFPKCLKKVFFPKKTFLKKIFYCFT